MYVTDNGIRVRSATREATRDRTFPRIHDVIEFSPSDGKEIGKKWRSFPAAFPHRTLVAMSHATSPLVSVIVPVYNAERYLRHCLDSIVGQSYGNLEILLVDDGSSDGSPLICDEYARADERVKVIHRLNGGIASAQNAGLDAARGCYIAFADNDDILDRNNIMLLLHALESTGSDMSKARWRQFGVSQMQEVASTAARGADAPESITVFAHPLHAYQNVFCKTLRLLGDALGRNTEARYFNEANWCRLYRRELWEGLRFPEGMYAQDVMVAGELYSRMHSVADIDVNLYNWLQSPDSVTHTERSFAFYHDNVAAGLANFRLALDHGITPMRSYYTMMGSLREEATANGVKEPDSNRIYGMDQEKAHMLLNRLRPIQRVRCSITRLLRLGEKIIYDSRIKNMR